MQLCPSMSVIITGIFAVRDDIHNKNSDVATFEKNQTKIQCWIFNKKNFFGPGQGQIIDDFSSKRQPDILRGWQTDGQRSNAIITIMEMVTAVIAFWVARLSGTFRAIITFAQLKKGFWSRDQAGLDLCGIGWFLWNFCGFAGKVIDFFWHIFIIFNLNHCWWWWCCCCWRGWFGVT